MCFLDDQKIYVSYSTVFSALKLGKRCSLRKMFNTKMVKILAVEVYDFLEKWFHEIFTLFSDFIAQFIVIQPLYKSAAVAI